MAAREAAILNAARDVFVENGYDDGRVAEIARRAGVAEGTVYLYYRTKKDLVRAVIEGYWQRLTEQAQKTVDPSMTVFDQLEAFARFHLKAFLEDIEYINLNIAMRAGHRQYTAQLDHIRPYVRVFDSVFERGKDRGDIRADVPTWVARDVFFGTMEHSSRSVSMDPRKLADDAIANLIDLFRAGYGTRLPRTAKTEADAASALDPSIERLDQIAARLEAQLSRGQR